MGLSYGAEFRCLAYGEELELWWRLWRWQTGQWDCQCMGDLCCGERDLLLICGGDQHHMGGDSSILLGELYRLEGGLCQGDGTAVAVISWPSICPPSMCSSAFSASSRFSNSTYAWPLDRWGCILPTGMPIMLIFPQVENISVMWSVVTFLVSLPTCALGVSGKGSTFSFPFHLFWMVWIWSRNAACCHVCARKGLESQRSCWSWGYSKPSQTARCRRGARAAAGTGTSAGAEAGAGGGEGPRPSTAAATRSAAPHVPLVSFTPATILLAPLLGDPLEPSLGFS